MKYFRVFRVDDYRVCLFTITRSLTSLKDKYMMITPTMERRDPLSTRSPNRPPPPSSVLKKTIQTPSTIRKTTTAQTKGFSSPGKSSPTRQCQSRSTTQSPLKTPKPRPLSMADQTTVSRLSLINSYVVR